MTEVIELFVRDMANALQTAKIYGAGHPRLNESANAAYAHLAQLLRAKDELALGIVGDELAHDKEIFFDLSVKLKHSIRYLKQKGAEKLTFRRGVSAEEFQAFIGYILSVDTLSAGGAAPLGRVSEHIDIGKITTGLPKEFSASEAEPAGALRQYEDSLGSITHSVDTVLQGGSLDNTQLRFVMGNVMENLVSSHTNFFKLATMKKYDSVTFTHLLNVSILTMYCAARMRFKREDIIDMGIAALFHDIGKLHISRKIIGKSGVLTTEEFARIKSHTTLGAELLVQYTEGIGILPVVVAFEHHIRFDGGGYPKVIFGQKPHFVSRIVSLCDVYDALTQRRSYKRDYPPDMIYALMVKERGCLFDPELMDEFFRIMGVWPVGTLVVLDEGSVAVVRNQNSADMRRPVVEIIHPEYKKGLYDTSAAQASVIAQFLNPMTEGKEYIARI